MCERNLTSCKGVLFKREAKNFTKKCPRGFGFQIILSFSSRKKVELSTIEVSQVSQDNNWRHQEKFQYQHIPPYWCMSERKQFLANDKEKSLWKWWQNGESPIQQSNQNRIEFPLPTKKPIYKRIWLVFSWFALWLKWISFQIGDNNREEAEGFQRGQL